MRVQPISYNFNNRNRKNISDFSNSAVPAYNYSTAPLHYYRPTFGQNWDRHTFEEEVVKQAKGKKYQGRGLYTHNGNYINWNLVGWDNLKNEPINWKQATNKDIYVFWQALALAETNDTTWVRRFNKYNVTKPLASFHTLSSEKAKERFQTNLIELRELKKHDSLDIPVFDPNGNISINFTVFDTETTGVNINKKDIYDTDKPLDKIIQIGAIQIKNGKISPETGMKQLINPEMNIPEGATAVHGITDDMVKDAPTIEKVLKRFVNDYLNKKNGVIVAYNSNFDITILNNAIEEHNKYSNDTLKEKRFYKVLDPFILIQRIHPYLGARKKLSEQYKFLFGRNLDGAHDAFADVSATVDVLKYCLYWMNEHRVDKNKPLTLREVLFFQNGGKVKNLDIPLDKEGANANVNFNESYRKLIIGVDNFLDGYKLSKETLEELKPVIGYKNYIQLKQGQVVDTLVNLESESEFPINPRETEQKSPKGSMVNAPYVMRKNFMKVLDLLEIEGFNDKSKEEIISLITEKSKHYINEEFIDVWMKNPNPSDIKKGNDLPDIQISKKVMLEKE